MVSQLSSGTRHYQQAQQSEASTPETPLHPAPTFDGHPCGQAMREATRLAVPSPGRPAWHRGGHGPQLLTFTRSA